MAVGFRRRRYHTNLGKPKGYVTRNPPIRKLAVYLQTLNSNIKNRISRRQVKSILGRPVKQVVIPPIQQIIPQIVVYLQAVLRSKIQIRTKSQFFNVFGYTTKNPPVRKLAVHLQAVNRSRLRPRLRTHSTIRQVFGGLLAFISYGAPFLFTVANWGTIAVHLEVYFRAVVGTVFARLFDETSGIAVTNSEISTTDTTFQRIRSAALTLTDTHVYRLQLGKAAGESGEIISGRLIVINT